jgi:hypothetical protein
MNRDYEFYLERYLKLTKNYYEALCGESDTKPGLETVERLRLLAYLRQDLAMDIIRHSVDEHERLGATARTWESKVAELEQRQKESEDG